MCAVCCLVGYLMLGMRTDSELGSNGLHLDYIQLLMPSGTSCALSVGSAGFAAWEMCITPLQWLAFVLSWAPPKKCTIVWTQWTCPQKSGFNTSSITRSRTFGSRSHSLITEIHSQTARKKLSLHKVGISIVCIVCKFPDNLILNSFISQLSRFDYS